jgi:hypothetical protein
VELQLDGSFKQLGAVLDMSGHQVTQFNIAKGKLAECVRRVRPRMASSESKWLALEKSVYETVAHYAKCMPWSMSQYRELDGIVSGLLRSMRSDNLVNP